MQFEWNEQKAQNNLDKHGINFKEAATVFCDFLSITFSDPDHSENEQRFITMGISEFGKILIVAHTDRNDIIRIISARKATKYERKFYEEG